jgi:hypothetical protein
MARNTLRRNGIRFKIDVVNGEYGNIGNEKTQMMYLLATS